MRSGRDYQRARVYAWEDRVVAPCNRGSVLYAAAQGMVDAIWADLGLRFPPKVERLPGQARRLEVDASRLRLRLPGAVPSWLLLHELAHSLSSSHVGTSDGHGPEFMGLYIQLLVRYMRFPEAELRQFAAADGIDVSLNAQPMFSDTATRLLPSNTRECRVTAIPRSILGNIASPAIDAAPLPVVKALWGGKLPVFDSLDAMNEMMGVLVMGLWNQLTRHQERSAPFRLLRMEVPPTRDGLARLARVRQDEVQGFVDGLFGDQQHLKLPERAHQAFEILAELRGSLEAARELAEEPAKPAVPADIAITLSHFRQLTKIIEHENARGPAVLHPSATPVPGHPARNPPRRALTLMTWQIGRSKASEQAQRAAGSALPDAPSSSAAVRTQLAKLTDRSPTRSIVLCPVHDQARH